MFKDESLSQLLESNSAKRDSLRWIKEASIQGYGTTGTLPHYQQFQLEGLTPLMQQNEKSWAPPEF